MTSRTIKLCVLTLWLGAACLAAGGAHTRPAAAQTPAPTTPVTPTTPTAPTSAPAPAVGLTAQERRGKMIYLRGESPSGQEIKAMVGELDVPASTLTCAGCHGLRGEGKTEGGVTAGELTWASLTKPYGHTHPSGRKHPAFTELAFIRAVVQGVDPAGNELDTAMPRFRFTAADMADLLAYLKRIETERDPGISATTLKVGTLLPTTGALAETGAAMREMLNAYFNDLNSKGGIFNRRLELVTGPAGANAPTMLANARQLLDESQPFALVGGITAGADDELAALAAERELPLIGPATLLPQVSTPPNRYVFYVLPGLPAQARALVQFAAQRPDLQQTQPALVWPEGDPLKEAAAQAAAAQMQQYSQWHAVGKLPYRHERFDAAQLARTLQQQSRGAVFFFGTSAEQQALLAQLAAAAWTPTLLLLGPTTDSSLFSGVPASFQHKVFLSFPTIPADVTPAGEQEYRALLAKYQLTARHPAAQLAALAAAKLFVEALKRAGQDLSREKLITALEGLYEFDTALTPRVTFGPNRRIGALGAYIVVIDTERKAPAIASDWIKLN